MDYRTSTQRIISVNSRDNELTMLPMQSTQLSKVLDRGYKRWQERDLTRNLGLRANVLGR